MFIEVELLSCEHFHSYKYQNVHLCPELYARITFILYPICKTAYKWGNNLEELVIFLSSFSVE